MPRLPANYKDPPPGKGGWEWDKLQTAQKLAVEEAAAQASELTCAVRDAAGASKMPEIVEQAIRSLFQFDDGWSFFAVEKLVYGGHLMMSQNIGNCVGASHCMLIARRIAHEVLAYGQLEEPWGVGMLGCPFIPYSYGVGRDAAGIRGRSDGSTCQGQFKGTNSWGILPAFIPGLDRYAGSGNAALPQGTASAGKTFGANMTECEKWTQYADPFRITEAPRVATVDDVWEAIVEKHMPIQICSGQGFRFWRDDSVHGPLYRRGGSWAHSMQLLAAMEHKGERFVCIGNQWGESAHAGNDTMGIPAGNMVIPVDELEAWLPRSHAVAVGEIEGLDATLSLI